VPLEVPAEREAGLPGADDEDVERGVGVVIGMILSSVSARRR
jgi:hypothetical protein